MIFSFNSRCKCFVQFLNFQKRFYEIPINQAKKGQILSVNSKLVEILTTSHHQQGRSGSHYKLELKDLATGAKSFQRFQSNATCEAVQLSEVALQFLYISNDVVIGLDQNMLEFEFPLSIVQGGLKTLDFLNSDSEIKLKIWDGKPVLAIPPAKGIFTVKSTDPTVGGSEKRERIPLKKALLDNDVEIMVPEFIAAGEQILVSISDQKYISRLSK
jgi:elongation factor P